MKINLTLIAFILLNASLHAQSGLLTDRLPTSPGIKKENVLPAQASDNWYDKAKQVISEQEYAIKWKEELHQYVAVNRKNRLGFYFNNDGYRVIPFSLDKENRTEWEYSFRLNVISRDKEQLKPLLPATFAHADERLVFQYPGFDIEYLNDQKGMRQNFIVHERLNGNGSLKVVIDLDGSLVSAIENNSKLLLSSVVNGKSTLQMSYDELVVWDNDHKPLKAGMELAEDGRSLIINVDDRNAVYPITIDPLNHTADWTDNGLGVLPSLDVLYGSTVSGAGDVNNDGYDDIIIGAPANIDVLSSSVIASTGQAFIYLGSSSGPSATPDITLQSSLTVNALFGFSVSGAGDINNDGFADVIVGAPGDNVTLNFGFPFFSLSNNIGKAYIYYGNATPASIPGSVVNLHLETSDFLGATFGLTINPLYGYSVSSAGDVNNDGFADVIIGSPMYFNLGTLTLAGRATVYLGSGSGLDIGNPIHRSAGLLDNTLFGYSVSSAGDMNNDGTDEVLIGAPGALSLLPGLAGKVYVYPGIASPAVGGIAASPVTYSDGALLKTLFGFSVSKAGDVNNDGFGDIVVGQPGTLSLSGLVTVGRASVFYGSASLSNKATADATLKSPRDPDIFGLLDGNLLFGFSVSGGKDLNCDGFDDIVVGEPGGSGLAGLTGINATGGRTYIFYGRNTIGPASQPGWELKETGSLVVANLLGYSVNIAGDVNNDGKYEMLVGAANGTLDLAGILSGVLNFVFVQSVGSAYVYNGCMDISLFVLPATITQFTASLNGNDVFVKWRSENEHNVKQYEVERSVNGQAFEKIGIVSGRQNNSTINDYDLIDHDPKEGNNTYRLKIVDMDGKSVYSSSVTVKVKSGGSMRVRSTFVQTSFDIEFNNVKPGDYTVDVLSMDGKILQSTSIKVNSGYSLKTVDIRNGAANGIYVVRVQGNGDLYKEKIVVY